MSNTVIEVSQDSFETEVLNANTPVLIDFWAPWCGPCRAVAPILDKLAEKYEGKVKIVKINVDDNPELAANANVRSIPNFVVYKNGESVEQKAGAMSEANFDQWLTSL